MRACLTCWWLCQLWEPISNDNVFFILEPNIMIQRTKWSPNIQLYNPSFHFSNWDLNQKGNNHECGNTTCLMKCMSGMRARHALAIKEYRLMPLCSFHHNSHHNAHNEINFEPKMMRTQWSQTLMFKLFGNYDQFINKNGGEGAPTMCLMKIHAWGFLCWANLPYQALLS